MIRPDAQTGDARPFVSRVGGYELRRRTEDWILPLPFGSTPWRRMTLWRFTPI